MAHTRATCLIVVAAVALSRSGSAQDRSLELGLDGAVSYSFVDESDGQESNNVQTWAFPLQRIRAGFFVADVFQVQLSTGFEVADYGETSTVRFAGALAGNIHPMAGSGTRGVFVSLGGGFNLLSDMGSDTQWSIGGGIGYKVPLSNRVALRPAVEFARAFESEKRLSSSTIALLIGLSFFTG